MKNACIILCSLFILSACGSSDKKAKNPVARKETTAQSAADIAIQDWLKGKIWTAENDMAPMSLLKLKSDGNYELKTDTSSSPWQIINGQISLSRLTEWPIEKLSDTAFRLYVKPTDKWYIYKHTSTL